MQKPLLVYLSQPKRLSNSEYHVYKLRNVPMHCRTHYSVAKIHNSPPVVIVTELEERIQIVHVEEVLVELFERFV